MEEPRTCIEISDSYKKYVINIHVDGVNYFIVWGPDSTDQENDKLLIDQNNSILLFSSLNEIPNYLLNSPALLFDELKMTQWAESCLVNGVYCNAAYDLDFLLQLITNDVFTSLYEIRRDDSLNWVNFINLVGDYAHQTGDTYLLELYKSAPIYAFWDYVYDTFFWTIPKEELTDRQKLIAVDFDYSKFRNDAIDLISQFKSRFKLISDNA